MIQQIIALIGLDEQKDRALECLLFPKLFLNDKIYSYTKKTIWHLAIWQN
jgi:hypothetical protein